jgi:hypothetical protein
VQNFYIYGQILQKILKNQTIMFKKLGITITAILLCFNPLNSRQKVQETSGKTHDADVIVCGGGPAGVAAAIASARKGAKTILIEQYGVLGGAMTSSLVGIILDYRNKTGIMKEIVDRLEKTDAQYSARVYDAELMKVTLDQMCEEAGVNVRLYTRVTGAKVSHGKDRAIEYVTTESTSGTEKWYAKIFIDATGNGDLGAYAGCGFDLGQAETGKMQPMSLLCTVTGISKDSLLAHKFLAQTGLTSRQAKVNLNKEFERAGIKCSYKLPTMFPVRDDLFAVAMNQEYGYSSLSAEEMTKATLDGRKEINTIVENLRKLGGMWAGIRIVNSAAQIGVREGRRIHGMYTLTTEDITKGAKFEDAVCKVTFNVDVHSLDSGQSGYSTAEVKSKPYDIPLRCLIAKDVDNMMMAGRCISGDFYAHASYRVIGDSVSIGEAAGKVAAESAMTGVPLKKISANKALD